MNRNELESIAADLRRFVIENGRVLADDPDSLEVEVEYEASTRGHSPAEASLIASVARNGGL